MLEIGAVVEADGDTMPGFLVGKAAPVKSGKVAVTNPAKDAIPEAKGGL